MPVIQEPTLLLGVSSVGDWLAAKSVRNVFVVMDPAIVDSPLVEDVCASARSAGCLTTEKVLTGPTALPTLKTLARHFSTSEVVIAIGGGTVLDQAKLARALLSSPTLEKWLASPGRAGWVSLPAQPDSMGRWVAVPTTIGTGSEVNSVACLEAPDGKRLVHGPVLYPDATLRAPEATRTLPGELVVEGVFEALSRTIGPYVGSHDTMPLEDGIAESLAETLAQLGHRVRNELDTDGKVADDTRMEIARASSFSHTHWVALGRDPFAYKAWFLATEISQVAQCRKTPALVSVLPSLWRQILSGNQLLGSAPRLRRIWGRVAAAMPNALPVDPVEGMTRLAQQWKIEAIPRFDVDAVVRRLIRRWGAGLPMLAGISSTHLHEIITGCMTVASGHCTDADPHGLLVNAS